MPDTVPTTSIFEVFAQVDQIAADIQVLSAQSPTYRLFGVTLANLAQQVLVNQGQLNALQNQVEALLILIQAIISGGATLANQNQIILMLGEILATVRAPRTVGLDTTVIETEPQLRPARTLGLDATVIETAPQPRPGRPGP